MNFLHFLEAIVGGNDFTSGNNIRLLKTSDNLNILPIINDSEFVISIDSSLKHLAACTDTKTIALYNKTETRPEKIGYSFQTNLICENDICIDIDPVDILETIRKECYG